MWVKVRFSEVKGKMDSIVSDVSKRTLVVKGMSKVASILDGNNGKSIINVKPLRMDFYQVEIIYRVGDYLNKH
jgi:uncharacterized protein YutD